MGDLVYPQNQGWLAQPNDALAETRQTYSCLWKGPWWWGGLEGLHKAEKGCSAMVWIVRFSEPSDLAVQLQIHMLGICSH